MRQDEAELVAKKLHNYAQLDLRGRDPDPVGWIALHYSVTRRKALSIIRQAEKTLGRTLA